MQLHYQTIGQGQPLLLLHGLFGSGDNWGRVAKHFANTHQVVCVDLRNHGKSPHSALQTYVEMAADLAELCESLNLQSIDLVGHSLGGKVAMQFATTYAERMRKLVVVDMAIRTYPDAQTHLMDAMLAINLNAISSRSEADALLATSVSSQTIRQFLLMNLIKVDGKLQWRINLPALKANYPNIREAICATAQYPKPCLFIYGERSDYVLGDDIAQLKTHFSQAQFASLPTGHWVHAEQTEPFIHLVDSFLHA
jgi:esterase